MAIPFEQKLIAVLFSLTLLLVTLQLIRKHRLREEYALVWFAASLAIFIFSVFDGLIRTIAAQFGVTDPSFRAAFLCCHAVGPDGDAVDPGQPHP